MHKDEKEVIIHVGFPKCGSTYLQRSYFPFLPNVFWYKESSSLPGVINRFKKLHPFLLDKDGIKKQLKEELDKIRENKVLISNEGFVGQMFNNFWEMGLYLEYLSEFFPNVKILLFTRRQDTLIEAIYNQTLKSGFVQPFNKFVNYSFGRFGFGNHVTSVGVNLDVHVLDYYRFTKEYEQVFGQENVKVLPYELLKADPDRFFDEINEFIGVSEVPKIDNQSPLVNKSYSKMSTRLARILNPLFKFRNSNGRGIIPVKPWFVHLKQKQNPSKWDKTLLRLSEKIDPRYWLEYKIDMRFPNKPASFLSQEQREKVLEIHRSSNEKLDQEYELGLQQLDYF